VNGLPVMESSVLAVINRERATVRKEMWKQS
jgi:hypothetical protein